MFIGALLILMGILMLLDKAGIIQGNIWGYFWPAAIMALGLHLIFRSRRPKKIEE